MPQLDGIDCSSNQPSPALEDHGYDEAIQAGAWFAFEKATGSTSLRPWATYTNPYYAHRRQLIAQKFRCGGTYHWVQVNTPAELEVGHFQKVVGDLWQREGIQVDSEQAGVTTQHTADVVNLLYARYGARIIVYGNLARLKGLVDLVPADVYFWLPWYDDPWWKVEKAIIAAGLAERIIVWQWGGDKQGVYLPSLNARVDSNYVLDPPKFRACCGLSEAPPTPNPPPPIVNVTGEDVLTIVAPVAQNGQVCYARFAGLGSTSKTGGFAIPTVEWIDGPTYEAYKNMGFVEQQMPIENLHGVTLLGPYPTTYDDGSPMDPVHTWSASDFRRVVG